MNFSASIQCSSLLLSHMASCHFVNCHVVMGGENALSFRKLNFNLLPYIWMLYGKQEKFLVLIESLVVMGIFINDA